MTPPVVTCFLFCGKVQRDPLGGYLARRIQMVFRSPHAPVTIPGEFLISLTDVHGKQHLRLDLIDALGNVVWRWEQRPEYPIEQKNPLETSVVTIEGVEITLPRHGAYNFVLYANDVEIYRTRLALARLRYVAAGPPGGAVSGN